MGKINKQTFIFDVKTDKRTFDEWIAEHDETIRTDIVDELKELIEIRLINSLSLEGATKYGNKDAVQQTNSYSTVMKYEIADCINDLLDDLEQLKGQKLDWGNAE